MGGILPVIKKELKSYFNSPIAYIVVLFFLIFTSVWLFYLQQFLAINVASLRPYFAAIPLIFIVLLPSLTMRSWAEEKKLGTEELLFTLPFHERDLVLGKFLSTFILLMIIAALTIPLPLTLSSLGHFENGQLFGEYLGMLLLGAAGISIGQFMSAVSTNQITAFIASVILLLILTLAGQLNAVFNLPGWLSSFLNYISFDFHFESFRKGLIDSRDVIYFVILSVLFLYLTIKLILFRKWK
ncbi:MAG: ABC transporter permease [Spirochaetota bacterium]